jgi:hypothetical protein
MTGMKSLFRVTLRRHDLVAEIFHLKEPVKLPQVKLPKRLNLARDAARAVDSVPGWSCRAGRGELGGGGAVIKRLAGGRRYCQKRGEQPLSQCWIGNTQIYIACEWSPC